MPIFQDYQLTIFGEGENVTITVTRNKFNGDI